MRRTLFLLSALLLAGCSAEAPEPTLRATLVGSDDVVLDWPPAEPGAAGRVLEFATGGDYTVLQFMPPAQTRYTHPDLIPHTHFQYRLRPYAGPVSATTEVVLPPGEFDEATQALNHDWAVPVVTPGDPATQHPVRSAEAAPTDFRAVVEHANGIRFTWTDHATDEEGYLLELRTTGDYRVAAVFEPDVTSAGLITLPEEKAATYRVRAFRYGPPSTVADVRTGQED
ncbi:fibronectin type III domain-containing protein [Amycolatopsis sp. 195334CR]|uniref:fibronectin type III domain-containing protein n=1 Tax=Amycolatopsis sp. 195334CR TaxID=2814588 RepID=UPI001A9006E5|nr:fibronectin type III domain-containing protein [Amycolatopsis sp. 195334CR]MBN6038000.1 fibronectin type III domain-containing protein [Amycolatopsis sp. 195334CR]